MADPAVEKGGGQVVDQRRGFQGAGPLAGFQGAEPLVGGYKGPVRKFCISELNLRNLVHTFCQHILKISWSFSNKSVIFLNLWYRLMWKWVIYPAHASPSSSPSYSPIHISCRYAFVNRSYRPIGAARGSIVRVKAKAGIQGAEPLGGGQGAKPPEADAFKRLKLW